MTRPAPLSRLTEEDVRRALEASVPQTGAPAGLADRARGTAGRIRTRRRATVSVLSAAVVVALVAIGVPALTRGDGSGPNAPAASTGASAGQSPGQSTAPNAACAENPCTPAEVVAGIRKPLDLPTLAPGEAPGEACPVSATQRFAAAAGFTEAFDAVGPGPMYFASPSADVQMGRGQGGAAHGSRWLEQKVIWVVDRSYVGGLLLRGRRIDGPGELRFLHYLDAVGYTGGAGDGKRHPELAYVRGGLSSARSDSVSSYPSGIFVDKPGCYAVQVDGVGFSETIVFRALAP